MELQIQKLQLQFLKQRLSRMDLIQKLIDGRTDLIFKIIEEGNPANLTDDNGVSLIRWCAYYGDVSAIRFLISKGASLDDLGNNLDLNEAVFHGHWQLCQYLLENGANANSILEETGESILHSAFCSANRPESNLIIQLLIEYGADPNVHTLPHAETGGFMRDALTKAETPLHRAAAFGNEDTINLLLEAGADKTAKDMNRESPLSWASWHQRPASILALLSYGEHRIHPLHIKNIQADHGSGWGAGMSILRLGKIHPKKSESQI